MTTTPKHSFDKKDQNKRYREITKYLNENVLKEKQFKCKHHSKCAASCREEQSDFYKGQLHHIGKHYSLLRDGKPFRVVIIGEQYGESSKFVSLEKRYEMIDGCNDHRPRLNEVFKEGATSDDVNKPSLNPHMTGSLAALRFIFNTSMSLPYKHEDSYINIDGDSISLFDCFALTNYLLCSATKNDLSATHATDKMWENCSEHIEKVLKILQPTYIILQGVGKIRPNIEKLFGPLNKHGYTKTNKLGFDAGIFAFRHPSGRYGWGNFVMDEKKYLRITVEKVIRKAMGYQTL